MTKSAVQKNDDVQGDPDPKPDDGGTPAPDPTPEATPPIFSFDTLSEEQRGALAAVAALLTQDESKLDANTLVFAKSAIAATKQTTDKMAIAKSILGEDGITAVQAPVRAELEAVSKRIELLEGERTFEVMKSLAAEFPGADSDAAIAATATNLVTIKKAMTPEQWDAYVTGQKALATQVSKSALFETISSRQPIVAGSAEQRINTLIGEVVSKSDGKTDFAAALGQIAQSHPNIYAEYQSEVRGRAASK